MTIRRWCAVLFAGFFVAGLLAVGLGQWALGVALGFTSIGLFGYALLGER